MEKYKLYVYGWELYSRGYSLTDEQILKIKEISDKTHSSDLSECFYEIEEVVLEYNDPNLFSHSAPLDTILTHFELKNEEDKIISRFSLEDMGDLYDILGEEVNDIEGLYFDCIPDEVKNKNILLVVDEFKGGIFYIEFESDEIPNPNDFSYTIGTIGTENGDWDFIDKIFFKGKVLEPTDYLDNTGKAMNVELYSLKKD